MKQSQKNPPRLFLRFFRWFCRPHMVDYIEGDLMEVYATRIRKSGKGTADLRFIIDVLLLFRPGVIRNGKTFNKKNTLDMYLSYFKVAWRNLTRELGYSVINVGGFALGIAVSILIGLWVNDELSMNKVHDNYDRIAAVMQNNNIDGNIETWSSQSFQLGAELRNNYGNNFKRVVMSTFPAGSILAYKDKTLTSVGTFMEHEGPALLSLDMISGRLDALKDPSVVLLSLATARNIFGYEDPTGKSIRLDNSIDLTVGGVFEDIGNNSNFTGGLSFIASLDVIINRGGRSLGWGNSWLEVFVQLADHADFGQVSALIRDAKLKNVSGNDAAFKPQLFLHPMSRWHLHSDFKNGVSHGGRIKFVILFGAIGVFVMLLACINFMNLSTARSQKRAKEVGVRKVIGSAKGQLIAQFFSESLLVVTLSFVFGVFFAQLSLPLFNEVARKNIAFDWLNPTLWLITIGFVIVVSVISGSYPAFYLSAFQPARVLKGTFRTGVSAALLRKVLVVVQFTVSIVLIIGTIVVYQQIDYASKRPLGYQVDGLVTIPMKTPEVKSNYTALRQELMSTGSFTEVARSETTITNLWWSDIGFQWKGKDPNMYDMLFRGAVDFEFGKAVGWKIKQGRDFSRNFPSDSSAMILNESAVKYMGLKDPIGEVVQGYGRNYTVIGVVEDMVTQSLFQPSRQTIFVIDDFNFASFIDVRINPDVKAAAAIDEMKKAFAKYNHNTPFEYTFASDDVSFKYAFEERVGKLVGIFASLAIVISCLGLLGLASFVAEQRTKEIGVRKVLGASVLSLWKMLCRDFVGLVVIAIVVAIPVGYYFMSGWLSDYPYRMEMSISVFLIAGGGSLALTLLTVSYQSIKAATASPVKSLRSE